VEQAVVVGGKRVVLEGLDSESDQGAYRSVSETAILLNLTLAGPPTWDFSGSAQRRRAM